MVGTAVGASVARRVIWSPHGLDGRGRQILCPIEINRSACSTVRRLHGWQRRGEPRSVVEEAVAIVHAWLTRGSLMPRMLGSLGRLCLLSLVVLDLLLNGLLLEEVLLLVLLRLVVLRGELIHASKALRGGNARRHGRGGNVVLRGFGLRREQRDVVCLIGGLVVFQKCLLGRYRLGFAVTIQSHPSHARLRHLRAELRLLQMSTVIRAGRLGIRRALSERRLARLVLLLRGQVSLLGSLEAIVEDVLVCVERLVGALLLLRLCLRESSHGGIVQLVLVDIRDGPVQLGHANLRMGKVCGIIEL